MSDKKPLVLVIGATGVTGQSIMNSVLKSGQYVRATRIPPAHLVKPDHLVQRVAALTRPSSASKPEVDALRSKGVEIRIGDYTSGPPEKLAEYVIDVYAVVSSVAAQGIESQKGILKAAADNGAKRIIPCDFGTPGAKGVRALQDQGRPGIA